MDIVFSVHHIVRPGETINSSSMSRSAGGKGANQSVAVARAGQDKIFHAGKIGLDGIWIKDKLEYMGVRTDFLTVDEIPTGQAMIQVSDYGQNSIVLYAGANRNFQEHEIDSILSHFNHGDWLLLQNEINNIPYIIQKAHERGLSICFNPAPFEALILNYPLDLIDLFVLNEVEAEGLSGIYDPIPSIKKLTSLYPMAEIIITLGGKGVFRGKGSSEIMSFGTWDVPVLDTTAAGDTFIGFYIANIANGATVEQALYSASAASNITVMRKGAMESIPTPEEFVILDQYTLA